MTDWSDLCVSCLVSCHLTRTTGGAHLPALPPLSQCQKAASVFNPTDLYKMTDDFVLFHIHLHAGMQAHQQQI